MEKLILSISIIVLSIHSGIAQNTININSSSGSQYQEIPQLKSTSINFKEAKRIRELDLNHKVQTMELIHINDTIFLDLFEDKKYKAYIDKMDTDVNGTLTLRARIVDFEYSYCIISTFDGKSFMTIEVPENNEIYTTKYNHQTNKYYLMQIDKSNQKILEGAPPLIPPDNNQLDNNYQNKMLNPDPIKKKAIKDDAYTNLYIQTNELEVQDTVTVMIVYTQAAAEWSNENETDINNTISLLMAKSQLVLDNSNILLKLKLVYTTQIEYLEQNSEIDLENLTGTDDGIMDEVHDFRDFYCADFVVLLENIDFAGGIAWQLNLTAGKPEDAFSITRVQQASSSYSVIHEIGHNIGCHHPKTQNIQPGPGLFSYSAGWRWTGSTGVKFCDVMTYEEGKYFVDGINATTVPYFSNPDIQYQGIPIGDSVNADNARTIRQMKSVIAAYRDQCSNCTPPSAQAANFSATSITDNSVTISWVRGSGDSVLVVARQIIDYTKKENPVNGNSYTANPKFGFGSWSDIGSLNYVVYNGIGTSVNVSNLNSNTSYRFYIYEYSASHCYLRPALTGTVRTDYCMPPEIQATNFTTSSITDSSMTINWTRGDGNSVLVIANRKMNMAPFFPENGKFYNPNNKFGSDVTYSIERFVVYNGTGTSVNVTSLSPGTTYLFSIYEYNSTSHCYLEPALTGTATTTGPQWVQTNGPGGGRFATLAIKDDGDGGKTIFAATDEFSMGGIFRSTDYGLNWESVNNGLTTGVSDFAIMGDNIFAATLNGIFLSTDNGSSWKAVNKGLTETRIMSLAIDGSKIYAGAMQSKIFLSTDNGSNWKEVNKGIKGKMPVSSLSISHNKKGETSIIATLRQNLFYSDNGGVFLSKDNGLTWINVTNGLEDVNTSAFSDSTVFIGTKQGVFRSTNNCLSWEQVNFVCTSKIFVSGEKIFVAGSIGGVYLSTDNGSNWNAINNGLYNFNLST